MGAYKSMSPFEEYVYNLEAYKVEEIDDDYVLVGL